METIRITEHHFLLNYGRDYYSGEFNVEKVTQFLIKELSGILIENSGITFLRSLPLLKDLPIKISITKAYQNKDFWFAVFDLERPAFNMRKEMYSNSFVYKQGDSLVSEEAKGKYVKQTEFEGVEIYSKD